MKLRQLCCGLLSAICCLVVACSESADSNQHVGQEQEEKQEQPVELAGVNKLIGEINYKLEDGEALNQENPDTFWIPPKERRKSLVKDDLVKLVFTLTDDRESQTERMWVIVTSQNASGYTGVLDNDPYSTDQIKAGIKVNFEPRHVIDIYEPTNADTEEAQ